MVEHAVKNHGNAVFMTGARQKRKLLLRSEGRINEKVIYRIIFMIGISKKNRVQIYTGNTQIL